MAIVAWTLFATTDVNAQYADRPLASTGYRTIPVAVVGSETRWAFRVHSPAMIDGDLVRLEDIVAPLDPDLPAWHRLRRMIVTLVPLSRKPMMIDRARLTRQILNQEATASAIDWVGPTQIQVVYGAAEPQTRRPLVAATQNSRPTTGQPAAYRTEAYRPPTPATEIAHADVTSDRGWRQQDQSLVAASTTPGLDHRKATQLVAWTENVVNRQYQDLRKQYKFQISKEDLGLPAFENANAITHAEFLDDPASGDVRLQVFGYVDGEVVQSVVRARFEPHPVVVVPKGNHRRGDRLTANDLELMPLPDERWKEGFTGNLTEFVGLEVVTGLRPGVPINRTNMRSPILVRRNDLVTVQVLSNGFRVTTQGRVRADGSKGDLVEVETIEPKRRLFARVAAPGRVEITTRATQVN